MHVLATALFDRPAFRNCVSHGILLGDDGRKMSKSLRNYPDVYQMFDAYGSDAMRWFLVSSPVLRGGDMPVTEAGIRDAVRQVLLPLWNVWYFFSLYANADGYTARRRTDSAHLLDRYVLAKTRRARRRRCSGSWTPTTSPAPARTVRSYLDALTNWYVRRSRDRFWAGDADAFDTLYTVLATLCRGRRAARAADRGGDLARPDRRAVGAPDRLAVGGGFPADHELVADMDAVREVCSAALSLRKARGLRVRLPLSTLTVAAPGRTRCARSPRSSPTRSTSRRSSSPSDVAAHCTPVLTLVPRALGPRLGKEVQQVIKAVKAGDWQRSTARPVAAGVDPRRTASTSCSWSRPTRPSRRRCPAARAWWCWTPRSRRSWRPRASPATWSGSCSRPAATPTSTSRTGSRSSSSAEAVGAAVGAHGAFVAGEVLADSVELGPVADGFAGEVGDGEPVVVRVARV